MSIPYKKLDEILEKNIWKKMNGRGQVSFETKAKREEVVYQSFKVLRKHGYKIENPYNFKEKHVRFLVRVWEEQGIKDIQTRMSILRAFASWIGKEGMIGKTEKYLQDPENGKRKYVSNIDKTWSGQEIDAIDKVDEIKSFDQRIGLILLLMFFFGLRIKEAMLLHPDEVTSEELMHVAYGSKGGRERITQSLDKKLDGLLNEAKGLACNTTSSMIPDGVKFSTYRARIYRVIAKNLESKGRRD